MLTPAQYTVARMRASGLPRCEIALQLGVRPTTVDQHMHAACAKLGVAVKDRRALAVALLECAVGVRKRRNRFGLAIGEPVSVTGGRYAGRVGVFVGRANSVQMRVKVGGGTFALRGEYLRRIHAQGRAA
jgi:DNA-binding CsgD family transcriptional regulator